MERELLDQLLVQNEAFKRLKIETWDFSLASVNQLKLLYETRLEWFREKHNYDNELFKELLDSIVTIEDSHVYLVSITFENEKIGFAIIDRKINLVFFSGPLSEE